MKRRITTTRKLTGYALLTMGTLCAGGSLFFLVYFLTFGPLAALSRPLSNAQLLAWDALLSLAFFSVHSILIRRAVRSKLARWIPHAYYPALFAIVSGIVLWSVMLLWQPSTDIWIQLEGGLAWLLRGISLLASIGFILTVKSLHAFKAFDLLGRNVMLAHLRNQPVRTPKLAAHGAFRFVRHPLYALTLVIIWATPTMTLDRVIFNILWTSWMIVGVYLEEKDLVAEFGMAYREYRQAVPMLIPWRFLLRPGQAPAKEKYG